MKRISLDPLSDECHEIEKMKEVRCDNIIEYYRYSVEGNEANIIMKLCSGSLRDMMKDREVKFDEEKILSLITQVTNAMLVLDANRIMHLDLKPENILFENADYFKVCDFGCIKKAQYQTMINIRNSESSPVKLSSRNFGTPKYVSPEIIIDRKLMHKNSCDMWSLGVIIY